MPILSDLKEIARLERERLKTAQEHLGVLEGVTAQAERLAQIGQQERPATERFLQNVRDTARAGRPEPEPPVIVGPDGRAVPLPPLTEPSPRSRPLSPSRDISGGGAAGRSRTGPGIIYSTAGNLPKGRDWLDEHCQRSTIEIPNPRNPRAEIDDDMVQIEVWDCSLELGPGIIYYVPESFQALLGPTRSGKGSGGSINRGGRPAPPGRQTGAGIDFPTFTQTAGFGESRVGPSEPPPAPTPGDKLVAETFREVGREIVRELRESGDLGLAIRRRGGL